MKKHIGRITLQIVAILFLIVGFLGLFLPIVQGILCLVIGLYLFSLVSPWVRGHLHAWGRRHTVVGNVLSRLEQFNERLRRWFHLD